ncbi:MAG: divergent polysaccharide deacetylase family protein [Pseudomonadota bacterium]
MTKKRAVGKKKDGPKLPKTKKTEINITINLLKSVAGIFLLLLLVVAAGYFIRKYFPLSAFRQADHLESTELKKPKQKATVPTYEVYSEHDRTIPPDRIVRKLPPGGLPRVAIIIDDFGYDSIIARKFSELGIEITYSILPFSPQREKIAKIAREKKYEIMLHLPLEPFEYPRVDPGPGVLLASMSPDALIDQLKKDLDSVPYIMGVNNHMGSRMTTISTKMYQIFSILKKRDLFFIDSRTSRDSLCKPSARLLKIPFGERDVFLDHSADPDAIRKQIRRLVILAQRQGEAIGIGHPHTTTYRVLKEELPEIKAKVQFVKASSIVAIIGE